MKKSQLTPEQEARALFEREYGKNTTNFMTPEVLEYGMLGPNVAYEISKGTGFTNDTIYGLSIVKQNADGTTKRLTDMSGCEQSMGKVRQRMISLREAWRKD